MLYPNVSTNYVNLPCKRADTVKESMPLANLRYFWLNIYILFHFGTTHMSLDMYAVWLKKKKNSPTTNANLNQSKPLSEEQIKINLFSIKPKHETNNIYARFSHHTELWSALCRHSCIMTCRALFNKLVSRADTRCTETPKILKFKEFANIS